MVNGSNLRNATKRGWGSNDDLTNGAWLDKYTPGENRVSDLDSNPWHHVLHNKNLPEHREVIIEYKPSDAEVPWGQRYWLRDQHGTMERRQDGLILHRRVFVVRYLGYKLTHAPQEVILQNRQSVSIIRAALFGNGEPDLLAQHICSWVWPSPGEELASKNERPYTERQDAELLLEWFQLQNSQ